jgi:hypothetical protein
LRKFFSSPSPLKDKFAVYKILGCCFFLSILSIFHSTLFLLAWFLQEGNSYRILIELPSGVTFPLGSFKIFGWQSGSSDSAPVDEVEGTEYHSGNKKISFCL